MNNNKVVTSAFVQKIFEFNFGSIPLGLKSILQILTELKLPQVHNKLEKSDISLRQFGSFIGLFFLY